MVFRILVRWAAARWLCLRGVRGLRRAESTAATPAASRNVRPGESGGLSGIESASSGAFPSSSSLLHDAIQRRAPLPVLRSHVEERPEAIREANMSQEYYPLHAAASLGLPKDVLQFLSDAWQDALGMPAGKSQNLPLHLAVLWRAPAECVEFLADAYPQALLRGNSYGRLPLHCAVLSGAAIDVVRALVERSDEAALSEVDAFGLTPVRIAVRTHQLDVLRTLVAQHPMSLHQRAANGRGPIHDAVASGAPVALLKFLVERAPASVECRDKYGELPLHLVGSHTYLEHVRILVETFPSSVRAVAAESGRTPLHAAIIHDAERDVVAFLADRSRDASLLGIQDMDGCLPLHHSAVRVEWSLEIVTILVEMSPHSVRASDARGRLPVHVAAAVNWPWWEMRPTVKYLVEQCPESLQVRDGDGNLPLHAAVSHGAPRETVRFLAEQHPEAMDQKNDQGNLPLHIAVAANREDASSSSFEVVRFLVEKSPRAVRTRGAKGRFPLHVGLEKKKDGYSAGISRLLVEQWHGSAQEPHGDGCLPLHKAVRHVDQSFDLVQLLLRLYPEASREQGPDGDLPLRAALGLKEPSQRIVRLLVEECPASSLVVQDKSGRTPLHMAISQPTVPFELVQLLVERGPGALQKADTCGSLPLHVALASPRTATLTYAKCLVEACPESLQVLDRDGRTPLAVAIASAAPLDVVHFLLAAWPPALELLHVGE